MYKLLFLSGLVAACSLGDLCAMNGGEGRPVLSDYQKNIIIDFLNPNNFVAAKQGLGLDTPLDLHFCHKMVQRITKDDLAATKWAIAERFLFHVSQMQKKGEYSEICKGDETQTVGYEPKNFCKYFYIAAELSIYKRQFGKEYTSEILNCYMQDEEIQRHYKRKGFKFLS